MKGRKEYVAEIEGSSADDDQPHKRFEITGESDIANLVSSESLYLPGMHMPAIDIDYPAEMIPSRTPGHFHLYLDKICTWPEYRRVLWAMSRAGLIEPGYYRASVERKATFLRKPGVTK